MKHWLRPKERNTLLIYANDSHYDYYSLVFDLIPAHAKVKTHYNSLRSTRGFTDASYTTHLIIPATVIASRPAMLKL